MKSLPKNYRDVGASLSCLVDKDEDSSSSSLLLPPGILIRSSAWDFRPDIQWEDLGRPKTIINLREHRDTSCYKQLTNKRVDDNSVENSQGKNTIQNNNAPHILHISAANNTEKYDLTKPESRDWLISVLQELLKDAQYTGHNDEQKLTDTKIPANDHNHVAHLISSIFEQKSEFEDDDHVERDSATKDTTLSIFRVALAIILRRRLSNHHSPLLVHCRFGRDRTGIVIAFLLQILVPTVSDSILREEFLLSDLSCVSSSESSTCSSSNVEDNEMILKAKMFSDLTLQNLPSVFDYIESRKKLILGGGEYKIFRSEMNDIMHALESIRVSLSPSTPIDNILSTPFGFRLDSEYMKSEAKRYFKMVKQLVSKVNESNAMIGVDEKYHILWASFIFHFSLQKWYDLKDDSLLQVYQPWHESDSHSSEDKDEKTRRDETSIQYDFYRLQHKAIATQIAWTMHRDDGVNVIYPLPSTFDKVEKVQLVHAQLRNEIDQLEERINHFGNNHNPLRQRIGLLKKRLDGNKSTER